MHPAKPIYKSTSKPKETVPPVVTSVAPIIAQKPKNLAEKFSKPVLLNQNSMKKTEKTNLPEAAVTVASVIPPPPPPLMHSLNSLPKNTKPPPSLTHESPDKKAAVQPLKSKIPIKKQPNQTETTSTDNHSDLLSSIRNSSIKNLKKVEMVQKNETSVLAKKEITGAGYNNFKFKQKNLLEDQLNSVLSNLKLTSKVNK